jgi:hypothetical protein
MRYVLAYFALMLGLSGLSLLWAGEAYGLLLILVAAALIYVLVRMERTRRRERRYGGYGEAIEGYERRFTDAERELEPKLPENALDSPPLLGLLTAYEHDPTDAEQVRSDYAELRQRFLDWREEFEQMKAFDEADAIGLPQEFAQRYEELARELRDLTADVKRLESRAADVDHATEDPLDHIARAALKLEQTKAACVHRFAEKIPPELASQLAAGDDKLGQARAAIAKGAERPLDAVHLSQEVCALAASVEASAGKPVEAPAELQSECALLEAEVSVVNAKLATAVETYAPACLLEIKGCGSEAEQAVQRARTLLASDSGSTGDVRQEAVKEALARGHVLVKRIEDHLASLEQASLDARREVEQAELEIDKAWVSATASSESPGQTERADRIASRARELAAQARNELQQPRPDWFRVTALAERAAQMAQDLGGWSVSRGDATPLPSVRPDVEAARVRAHATIEEVRPIVAEADLLFGEDNMALVCLEHALRTYEDAVTAQTRLATAEDPDAAARVAMDGFGLAEESATAAREHAIGLRERVGNKRSGKTAASLLWGALGRPAAPE